MQSIDHICFLANIGCMECHIEGDFLLIWIDEETETIELVRLGSHSELFK